MANSIRRERVTWTRWDPAARRNRISHPHVYIWTDSEGYERSFDTRTAAIEAAEAYESE